MEVVFDMAEELKYKGKFPYPLKKFGSRFGPKFRRCTADVMKSRKGKPKYKGRDEVQSAISICQGVFKKAGLNPKTAESYNQGRHMKACLLSQIYECRLAGGKIYESVNDPDQAMKMIDSLMDYINQHASGGGAPSKTYIRQLRDVKSYIQNYAR